MNDIQQKLETARTQLILDKPFIGALVLRLPLKEADPQWCKTTATNAKYFYYNAQFIDALNIKETQFVLAHEALHCALSHFSRRHHRLQQRWDLACDYAINPLLVNDGLQAPSGSLLLKEYENMTAEEIYPCIDQNDQHETLDMHLYSDEKPPEEDNQSTTKQADSDNKDRDNEADTQQDPNKTQEKKGKGGDQPNDEPSLSDSNHPSPAHDENTTTNQAGQQNQGSQPSNQPDPSKIDNNNLAQRPPPLSNEESEQLEIEWQQRLAGAAQQAMQAGKISDSMRMMVEQNHQNQIAWQRLLARYLSQLGRDDYSYSRPSSRRGNPAIFPSLRSEMINLIMIIDISASINDDELNQCVNEINALKGYLRARITLHACDDKLCHEGPWIYEPWQAFKLPKSIKGRGGTNFCPAFDWLNQLDTPPDVVVYFTDADGIFPKQEPHYPVLWLVKGKKTVPWGERIQINHY